MLTFHSKTKRLGRNSRSILEREIIFNGLEKPIFLKAILIERYKFQWTVHLVVRSMIAELFHIRKWLILALELRMY